MDNSGFASVKKWLVNNFHPPIEHQPAGDESSRVGFTSAEHLAHNYAGQRLQAGSVTRVIAARSTLSKTTRALNMLKGTDKRTARLRDCIPQARVFGSRSTAGRVATPQDLSVTKQHRNDRWDRCTASAGDWQIITTTSHRSANQRYFMHNSATVHRMRMQSSALDSSRSQLCNDTSTGVVRHQMTKRRRLQKVVSYDVLHQRLRFRQEQFAYEEMDDGILCQGSI